MRHARKLAALFLAALFILSPKLAFAADCGGAVVCGCGDNITSNYTLPADLVCPYDGSTFTVLTISGSNITFNLNNHRVSGQNSYPVQPYTGWPSGPTDQDNTCIGVFSGSGNVIVGPGTIDGCQTAIAVQGGSQTVNDVTITNAGQIGINVNGSTGQLIENNTISGVFGYPIRDVANGATITGNEIDNNFTDVQINIGYSIQGFGGSQTGTISNNNIHDNSGITFGSLGNAVITGNTIARQKDGLFNALVPDIGADSTNTFDGNPIKIVSGASGTTYDGNSIGQLGYFACISCAGITLENMTAMHGIYFHGTTNSIINNIAISNYTSSTNPIMMDSTSTGNTLENSTFSGIGSSASVTFAIVANNTIFSNNTCTTTVGGCVFVQTGVTGATINNLKSYNTSEGDITDNGTGSTITNNSFYFPKPNSSTMIGWIEATRTGTIGTPISFSFDMYTAKGIQASCASCTWSVVASPAEAVTASASSNLVSGSFTPSRNGTYSLLVTVSDMNGNSETKNFSYLIGPETSLTTRYYYRYGSNPNIVNGSGMDGQPMSLTPPSVDEFAGFCSGWVQDQPEDIPPFPIALFTGVSTSTYYTITAGVGAVGLERFASYENSTDAGASTSVPVPGPYQFTTAAPTVSGLSWMMDSAASWNTLAIKLVNTPNPRFPEIQSLAATPSYADYTYLYASKSPLKAISNVLVPVLSSTNAGVYFDNQTGASASQTATFGGFVSNGFYEVTLDGVFQSRVQADASGFLTSTVTIPTGIHDLGVLSSTTSLTGNIRLTNGASVQ